MSNNAFPFPFLSALPFLLDFFLLRFGVECFISRKRSALLRKCFTSRPLLLRDLCLFRLSPAAALFCFLFLVFLSVPFLSCNLFLPCFIHSETLRIRRIVPKFSVYSVSIKSLCNFKNLLQRQMKRQISRNF